MVSHFAEIDKIAKTPDLAAVKSSNDLKTVAADATAMAL